MRSPGAGNFTVNWIGSSLGAGSTYSNRGFMFQSALSNVKATADALVQKTAIDKIELNDWTPRSVDLYAKGMSFTVKAASAAGGASTGCAASATLACPGKTTPQSGSRAFFYVMCGSNTYLGPDPYCFTPGHRGTFPGHVAGLDDPVRVYLFDGRGRRTTFPESSR